MLLEKGRKIGDVECSSYEETQLEKKGSGNSQPRVGGVV